jgi:hypothetical protein
MQIRLSGVSPYNSIMKCRDKCFLAEHGSSLPGKYPFSRPVLNFSLFLTLPGKNDPHIRVLTAFPGVDGIN